MSARDDILARLRGALDTACDKETRAGAVAARLASPPRAAAPGRVRNVDLVETFRARAEEVGATTTRVRSLEALGLAVADHLRGRNLPMRITTSPALAGWGIAWPPALIHKSGRAQAEDRVGVAAARAGIAETGTLMMASGPADPTTLNFLPEAHIVLLKAADIVGSYEDAWARLRDGRLLPRAVNLITGPSRTADIEQTLLVGVHGPKSLHIIILGEA